MEVKTLARSIGVDDRKVIRKAEEYARLCVVKRPMGLGSSEICKSAVCLELAASNVGAEFNRDRALQLAGGSDKIYQIAMSMIRTMLDIKSSITAKHLSVQFGCLRLEQPTLKLLKEFEERVIAKLHASRKKSFDFNKPVFLVAAFHLQATRLKINVDKVKLLSISSVSERQFLRVKQSMMEICYPEALQREQDKKEFRKKMNIGRKGKKQMPISIKMREKKEEEENDKTDANSNIDPVEPTTSTIESN